MRDGMGEGENPKQATPLDLARLLGNKRERGERTESNAPSSGGSHDSVNTNTIPHEKSFLVGQLEGTDLEKHDRTKKYLDRLDQVDISSFSASSQQAMMTVQLELAKTIGYYRDGRVDETGLQEMIRRIDKPYEMYRRYDNYPERELVRLTWGFVAELKHINWLVESGRAASVIIPGALPGMQYTLEHLTTGATERVSTAPLGETDALYLGRDGKIYVDEVKAGMQALLKALRTNPDQLSKLAAWQNQDPEKREARVVLSRPGTWTDLFKRIDSKKQDSPSAFYLLVEHHIPIHMGDTTFMPEDLKMLSEQVTQVLKGASKMKARLLNEMLSQRSPKDVALGDFQLKLSI